MILAVFLVSKIVVFRFSFIHSLFGKTVAELLIAGLIIFLVIALLWPYIGVPKNPERLVGEYSNLRSNTELVKMELNSNGNFALVSHPCFPNKLEGKWTYNSSDLYDYVIFELDNGVKFRANIEMRNMIFDSVNLQNCLAIKGRLVPIRE